MLDDEAVVTVDYNMTCMCNNRRKKWLLLSDWPAPLLPFSLFVIKQNLQWVFDRYLPRW